MRRIVRVEDAVVGPGAQLEELDLAEAGAERRALCLARVGDSSDIFLLIDAELHVVHLDVIVW